MTTANDAVTYDLVRRLGYRPNDWHGMWKLTPEPIVLRGFGIVVLREVVYMPRTAQAVIRRNGQVRTRLVFRRDPIRGTMLDLRRPSRREALATFARLRSRLDRIQYHQNPHDQG